MDQHREQLTMPATNLSVSLAKTNDEIYAAQRLRYEVFALECGARLESKDVGIDRDEFDEFCDHLIVRDSDREEVVGTYRILTHGKARECGSFYSESEFDLRNLKPLFPHLVEVGRSCIRQGYRQGPVITLLWAGLAQFMMARGLEYLMGCASIQLDDGGEIARSTYHGLKGRALSPDHWRVYPRHPFPLADRPSSLRTPLPPLIKGYVRLGAYVCGDPAWDREFNSADLLMLLPLAQMNPRYARHFMGRPCLTESTAA